MSTTASVNLTMAYTGTSFQRKYKLDNVATSELVNIKPRVIAYNQNLSAADKRIFISDDYDESQGIGELASIAAANYEVVEYTRIDLNGDDSNG